MQNSTSMRLVVSALHKSYQDADRTLTVIDNLSFEFPNAGSVGIIGRSGIGKSTLLHLLGGLDKPSSGTVTYGDLVLSSLDTDSRAEFRAKNVGFIFQFHNLLPEFSATENVAMPLIMAGEFEQSAHEKARELLARMNLEARHHHLPSRLSGGEQQRVSIARALVTKPAVVLADEPTGNLDVATAAEVQELLLKMNKELGNVLIVVTHNQELARSLDTVVEMMPGGSLVPAQ
jgi:lipoprotein-releasing system ATP-binding protein